MLKKQKKGDDAVKQGRDINLFHPGDTHTRTLYLNTRRGAANGNIVLRSAFKGQMSKLCLSSQRDRNLISDRYHYVAPSFTKVVLGWLDF
ncbi:uncharacterized protein CLUP02_14425 [Colletotrichum lupini]|uniref:Uncharacterized protein n=1 Tax=Colletotrichum lupini TaxID=145971 RepID=A0A9Q8WMC0_9PEZI|nr:uncharacterized protein CLUP02_14425 [Colletotrichum lupini]UQC88898.1 hypothetical protein CLUP02_14425 [Colletotrichum lupini]